MPGQPGAGAGGASEVWSAARAHLAAKRWKEALAAYDDLLARHGSSEIVVANRLRVDAGRKAADAGVRGPPALLRRPSRWKDGRLEVEYTFDSVEEMKADFAVEQPFPGNLERRADWGDGMALLTGSTALLHAIVYEPDLAWEAEFFSDDPHDFGLFALQEAKPYRAVSFEAGNTAKKLKKGAAAKVLAGHVLWLIGDGAWSATDPDELGFIFLDRTQSPRLEPAKKVRLSLAIRNGNAEAHLRTEADSASLSGAVRGDDGKGLGPLRPGVFAYTSLVGVERLKIEGKVDAAWFERRLGELAALDVGP